MSVKPLTKTCPVCQGSGQKPRGAETNIAGAEICGKCGGSGQVLVDTKALPEGSSSSGTFRLVRIK